MLYFSIFYRKRNVFNKKSKHLCFGYIYEYLHIYEESKSLSEVGYLEDYLQELGWKGMPVKVSPGLLNIG